ncbi:MAG: amidohydrolase family protein [Deltaproteobacteria bacterium]|nr:amidohydrolase family protein [Deltaproteobacteria bacterium]
MFVLTDCRIPTGRGNETRRAHVVVRGGRIVEVADGEVRAPGGCEPIDAGGLLALPGAIDSHVHFDTPGFTEREDFEHGTAAAAAGGVTTVIDMPCTSLPPVTSVRAMERKLAVIRPMARVDFALWGGASGNLLAGRGWREDLEGLARAGVVGFKAYLISGMETFTELGEEQLVEVLAEAARLGVPVGLHAEDPGRVRERSRELVEAGRDGWEAVALARAEPVEEEGVVMGLAALRRAQGKPPARARCALHVVHVGAAAAAARIGAARRSGQDVTAETCPHYLAFTRDDFATLGPYLKTAPVVKTAADRDGLWRALADGTLDFVATDHAPCPRAEKETGGAWGAYGGVPGVETMLPFLLSEGVFAGRMDLARLVEVTSGAAARRWGIWGRKGSLEAGKDADVVLVDPDATWVVRGEELHSKAGWTPFEGRAFRGKVMRTFVRGRQVYDAGAGVLGEPGWGEFIRR